MKSLATVLFVFIQLAVWRCPALARTWTDRSGSYTVEAELVAVRNGKVYLERTDGHVVSIPLDKLSVSDQEYLKHDSQPKEAANPARDAIPQTEQPEDLGARTTPQKDDTAEKKGEEYVKTLSHSEGHEMAVAYLRATTLTHNPRYAPKHGENLTEEEKQHNSEIFNRLFFIDAYNARSKIEEERRRLGVEHLNAEQSQTFFKKLFRGIERWGREDWVDTDSMKVAENDPDFAKYKDDIIGARDAVKRFVKKWELTVSQGRDSWDLYGGIGFAGDVIELWGNGKFDAKSIHAHLKECESINDAEDKARTVRWFRIAAAFASPDCGGNLVYRNPKTGECKRLHDVFEQFRATMNEHEKQFYGVGGRSKATTEFRKGFPADWDR